MRKLCVAERIFYSAISVLYPVIIIYSYFVFIGKYCIQTDAFDNSLVLIYFLVFHLLLISNCIFFLRIVGIDESSTLNRFKGKSVDAAIIEKDHFNPFIYQEIESKKKKMLKKCNYCKTYKPPRAHHCSICNKCLLKFDSHCKFIGVCIAFHNYKFFILFCASAILYHILVISLLLIELLVNRKIEPNPKIHFIIASCILSIDFYFITSKLIKHCFNISRNETTIESMALDQFYKGDQGVLYIFQEQMLSSEGCIFDRSIMNPYNLGFKENWVQVFGTNGITAVLPISTTPGDGINFPKQ